MRRRIFIAINLPEKIKAELAAYEMKWPELPVKWTRKDNLHVTLLFLGYLSDEEVVDVCQTVKETAGKHRAFIVNLTSIAYGPVDRNPPRMIWAVGDKSPEFTLLRDDLEKSLFRSPEPHNNARLFSPHVTLGRIKAWDFRKMELEERPEVEESAALDFEVNSIEVMESVLKRKGPDYTVLEPCQLKN